MNFALNGLDVTILVGSILLVIVVGLWASRRQDKTASGYFLASGKLPWWIIGSAFVSTSVSSEQIVGTIGAAYKHGMGIANWEWFALPMYVPLIFFFIPMYLKNRIATVPEFLRLRYGPVCANLYSGVMLVAYVLVFLVVVLYSGSLALSELTGWNFHLVLWGMIAIVGAYTIKGGLASVMWTDAVQCVLLVGGGAILFWFALDKIPGGWDAMIAANPDRFHLYRKADDPQAPFLGLVLGILGVFSFYQASNQVMVQRVLAARTVWDGMMGIVFAGFINLVRPLVTCFLGFIVYHWIHVLHRDAPLADPDTAFSYALKTFAPSFGLRGIIIAGFLAAVMSTISALANSTATLFSLDVYARLRKNGTDDATLVRVGRLASFSAMVIAGLVCPAVGMLGGIFPYFQNGITFVGTPIITVFLMGLFWKRANYPAAIFGMVAGLLLVPAALFAPKIYLALFGTLLTLHWLYLGFLMQVFIVFGMIMISLATRPPEEGQWKPFLWSPRDLKLYDGGARRPWYQSVGLWFGLYAVAWTYLYWRYW